MLSERETILSMMADKRVVWTVTSDDPVMVAKLRKIAEPVLVRGDLYEFELRAEQVSFRAGKRKVSDETRRASAERLAAARAARRNGAGETA